MPETNPLILDDLPTDQDALDFTPYATTLADICRTARTPLTIGIFGSWGTGKTSLMRMVRKMLPENYTVAWFDAWKYDNEETLWRAFLLSVLLAVEEKVKAKYPEDEAEDLQMLKTMLYRGLELEKVGGVTIDLEKLLPNLAKGAVQIGLSFIPPLAELSKLVENLKLPAMAEETVDAIRRERTKVYIEQVRSLEQFQDKFRLLIQNRVAPGGGRLAVFVDDLDRCLPEKAIEVLEAIKLFADAPECVYLLGLDHQVIARGVDVRYKDFWQEGGAEGENLISGRRYLEKIIQLPFTIPPVERADMDSFISGLTPEWPHAECPRVFAEGLGDNPRQIKRTVNVFLMLHRLSQEREKKEREKKQKEAQRLVEPVRLAKVVVIQAVAPELYRLLAEQPGLLRDLERYYRQETAAKEAGMVERSAGRELETVLEGSDRIILPEDLLRLVSRTPAVWRILTLHAAELEEANFGTLGPVVLRRYFTLARTVEAPQAAAAGAPQLAFEPQKVRVPAGEFLMGSTASQAQGTIKAGLKEEWVKREQPQHRVVLSEYWIGRYPVTNREYQVFIQETGHPSPEGWSGAEFPTGKGDHPVVYVSWEDTSAYCGWLSEKTGKPYRLPTEAEWEKAARGTDGRVYPWGDEFDPGKANTLEGDAEDTTPAGQYSGAGGDSPYGCADMAGNVWEWCADWFAEDEYQKRAGTEVKDPTGPQDGSYRLLRGGSFNNDQGGARCAGRYRNLPEYRFRDLGFRVALSPI